MSEENTQDTTKYMTREEVQLSTRKKVVAIETLCRQLEITLSAERVVTEQGIIRNMVYYTDNEKYPMVDEKAQSNEKTTTEPAPETTPQTEGTADKAEEVKKES